MPVLVMLAASLMCVGVALGKRSATRDHRRRGARIARAALPLLLALTSGCLTDLVPLSSPGNDGGAATRSAQVDCGDAGASGFACGIWPSVKMLGCPGCHSGGPPMKLIATPTSASDWSGNYMELSARAKMGSMSLVLTKNLVGSGVMHGGGSPFASTSDPTYVAWLDWINAGAPQ